MPASVPEANAESSPRRRWLLALVTLAGALFGWAAYQAQLAGLQESIRSVAGGWLALAVLVRLASVGIKALRLAVALDAPAHCRAHVVVATYIAVAGNALLPARLGELARAVVLQRRMQLPITRTLSCALVTQLLDWLLLVLLLLALLAWGLGQRQLRPEHAWLLLLVSVAALLVLSGLDARAAWPRRILRRLPPRLVGRVERLLHEMSQGALGLRTFRVAAPLAVLTIAVWSCEALGLALALRAFGIAPRPLLVLTSLTLLNLGVAVPLTPGNVGTHQVLSVLALGLFAVPASKAFLFSVGSSALTVLSSATIGGVFFIREGLRLAELRKHA